MQIVQEWMDHTIVRVIICLWYSYYLISFALRTIRRRSSRLVLSFLSVVRCIFITIPRGERSRIVADPVIPRGYRLGQSASASLLHVAVESNYRRAWSSTWPTRRSCWAVFRLRVADAAAISITAFTPTKEMNWKMMMK